MNYLKQKTDAQQGPLSQSGHRCEPSPFDLGKYMEKCAISNQVAAPINREAELKNDEADYAEECARTQSLG